VLPRRVDRPRSPETSWYTTGRAGGQWDASYDLWFTRNRQISGRSWWLESIAAGYELWRHGADLATTWFWARA
jgi:hypothetical protein